MNTQGATVKKIDAPGQGKVVVLTIEKGGATRQLKAWANNPNVQGLKEGSVLTQLETTEKPGYNAKEGDPLELWVADVKKGGGGFKGQPKDESSIVAQVILKEIAIELRMNPELDVNKRTDEYINVYKRAYAGVKP